MTLVLKRNRRAAAMCILVTDRIAQEGIDLLRTRLPNAQIDVRLDLTTQQLQAVIGQYTALIVRSETRVTSAILAAATQLKIVGRAGVGLDNIDTESAKRYGIAVVNSPGAIPSRKPNTPSRCSFPWHGTFLPPRAAPEPAGGRRATSWVCRCATRCWVFLAWERTGKRLRSVPRG